VIHASVSLQLENPIWQAATTRQRHLAYGEGPARRFFSEVLPMAALENHSSEAVAALTAIVAPANGCGSSKSPRVWIHSNGAKPHAFPDSRWRAIGSYPKQDAATVRHP
jgi:hypothetical protein